MDARDFAANKTKWYESFDENKMEIEVILYDEEDEEEVVSFPARFAICDLCQGKGSHVNPSIDSHGITMYEFYDDPEFAEEYLHGSYDVSCYECKGNRVIPEINEDEVNNICLNRDNYSLQKKLYLFKKQRYELARSDYECAQEREYELKMGGCW